MSLTEETDDKGRVPIHVLEARRTPHDRDACTRSDCGRCRPPAPGPAKAPTIKPNPHDADAPPPAPDRTVASIGLPKHSPPSQIARVLREVAKTLDESGADSIDFVSVLASQGFPASTLGDGGSRATDATSGPERAVTQDPGRWVGADRNYARQLRLIERLAIAIDSATKEILRHASTEDPTPAGSGECKACARYCKPSEGRPGDRLRSGLCPTCYRAWNRYQKTEGGMIRTDWASRRREGYTERDAADNVIRVHTPEPDHDIDLSSEAWTDG